ncbi:MAG: penicillin acylase family protein [Bacteroidetes bacterium]|nr:penicillin acylase family protein [Bacteroidota bacterium]
MRVSRFIVPLLLTVILVYVLDRPLGTMPALGRLLDPIKGWAANTEPVDKDFNAGIILPGVKAPAKVWFDEYMVPHIHAANEHDAYYTEGYLHAYFRLWQMDLEARAAGGRVSEIIGEKALDYDRKQRRKGMVYGAGQSLQAMEADPRTKEMLDAYTAGINTYIHSLQYKDYPIEYKLMGFAPEDWTNLKSALLLKYMADDLTGYTEDIEMTLLRDMLPPETFTLLYPARDYTSTPVIPVGTPFEPALMKTPSVPAGDIWAHLAANDFEPKKETNEGKGSNNWAVSGAHTKSGAPILCDDPHLGLNLPSLWYQVQIQTPTMNVYGVSLPGTPGVVIGFNDSISWGFTNNYRDVKDFYTIAPAPGRKDAYMFNGKPVQFDQRIERIAVKGKPVFMDTVNYTLHGPVIYDEHFKGPGGLKKTMALCWSALRPSNELLAVYLLNHARSYMEFVDAISNFLCPAQNMVYADKAGNIAMWGQGQFFNKWKDQGKYVMNGKDSSTLWGLPIPIQENPHALNPAQGYVSSANQTVTDSTYPYWYNGYFYELRAWRLNALLSKLNGATVKDMFNIQQDVHSYLAERTLPVMLRYVSAKDDKYLSALKRWNYELDAESTAATAYQVWWYYLYDALWKKMLDKDAVPLAPSSERTMQLMLQSDSAIQNKHQPVIQNLQEAINAGYNAALDSLNTLDKAGRLQWYKAKNTTIRHLAKLPAFSCDELKIGGWGNTINAAKGDHGPSWRMVVQMSKEIEAYGVYPGGQSGNPGSKYYATFVDSWTKGSYYRLKFLVNSNEQKDNSIKYTWTLKAK